MPKSPWKIRYSSRKCRMRKRSVGKSRIVRPCKRFGTPGFSNKSAADNKNLPNTARCVSILRVKFDSDHFHSNCLRSESIWYLTFFVSTITRPIASLVPGMSMPRAKRSRSTNGSARGSGDAPVRSPISSSLAFRKLSTSMPSTWPWTIKRSNAPNFGSNASDLH
jgi:hypothetical protein